MAIRVTANGLRNIIRSVILEESQRRNSQRRLQESRRRRAYRLYEGFEDKLNKYDPDAQELEDIDVARERLAALSQLKKPEQKAITHKDFSPFNYDYTEYMEDYHNEWDGHPPRGDKKSVGSVAKLYDMVMGVNSLEAFKQIEDFDNFESMVGDAYDEIHYYIGKSSPALDQIMSDIKVMIARMYELQDAVDVSFDDVIDLSDHINSLERLYNYFAGADRF